MAEVKAKEPTLEEKIAAMSPKERAKRLKEVQKELDEATNKLSALMSEDRTEYADGIIKKLMKEFKAGARWLERMQKLATEEFYVYSSLGRRRFLPAAMVGDQQLVSQQVRRGMNAPIQGMASEIGVKAGRCVVETYYKHLPTILSLMGESGTAWRWRMFFNRMVHDANYLSILYKMVIPVVHIMQWEATYGVTKRYKEEFGLEFTVEPEIEIEIAANDALSFKWDWRLDSLLGIILKAVTNAEELGQLESEMETPEDRIDDVMSQILEAWRNKKVRKYLQKHFPILGVTDLDDLIVEALDKYDADRAAQKKAARKAAKEAKKEKSKK